MPLDGHSYLAGYGWAGTGTGLRHGAVSRPLTIPPKKSLGGVGKDRDDAFPFWDHVFATAANAIKIKLASDSEGSDADDDAGPSSSHGVRRTDTGIISSRRPVRGTPATHAADAFPAQPSGKLGLLAVAKREAARKGLYSRFYRGPVIKQDDTPVNVLSAAEEPASPESPHSEEVAEETTVRRPRRVKDRDSSQKLERKANKKRKGTLDEATEPSEIHDAPHSEGAHVVDSSVEKKLYRKERKRRKRAEYITDVVDDSHSERDKRNSKKDKKKGRKKRKEEH